MTKIIKEEKAKQGRSGRNVLIVLIAALILAMAVWLGTEFYGQAIDPTPPAQEQTPG